MVATFQQLHQQSEPLILNNVWDAASAAIMQRNGAVAIATSSAAVAWSLGVADGGKLSVQQQCQLADRVLPLLDIPLSMDIEDGYSDDPNAVATFCDELYKKGVAGVNLEDGAMPPTLLAEKIDAIRQRVGSDFFINARTDVYLRNLVADPEKVAETINRARTYEQAGANGIFVPGTMTAEVFVHVCASTPLPVNAMITGQGAIDSLLAAGVKRFTTGPHTFLACYGALTGAALDFVTMNGMMDA